MCTPPCSLSHAQSKQGLYRARPQLIHNAAMAQGTEACPAPTEQSTLGCDSQGVQSATCDLQEVQGTARMRQHRMHATALHA
eukprot:1161080-Pelagomonas_calceolata.AAC.8